jgi:hypothetical protein
MHNAHTVVVHVQIHTYPTYPKILLHIFCHTIGQTVSQDLLQKVCFIKLSPYLSLSIQLFLYKIFNDTAYIWSQQGLETSI